MWRQAEGVSRPSQRGISPGGSLRLTVQEVTLRQSLLSGLFEMLGMD
jgi:hypothetical protein